MRAAVGAATVLNKVSTNAVSLAREGNRQAVPRVRLPTAFAPLRWQSGKTNESGIGFAPCRELSPVEGCRQGTSPFRGLR